MRKEKSLLREVWEEIPMVLKVMVIGIVLMVVVVCVGCNQAWWSWYPQDNLLEETVEEVIEQKTGLDLDLSPTSSERLHYPVSGNLSFFGTSDSIISDGLSSL